MSQKFWITFFTLIFTLGNLNAQDSLLYGIFPLKSGAILYDRNFSATAVNKSQLLPKLKEWASREFKTNMDTIRVNEVGSVFLFNTYIISLFNEPATNVALQWQCWQTIKITFTESTANIIITNLELKAPSGYGTVTVTKVEDMKNQLDSLPNSSFFGKNNRERYWQTQLVTFKNIDKKIHDVILSFERYFNLKKTD